MGVSLFDIAELYSSIIYKKEGEFFISPEHIRHEELHTQIVDPLLVPVIKYRENIGIESYFSLYNNIFGIGLHKREFGNDLSSIGYVSLANPTVEVKSRFERKENSSFSQFGVELEDILSRGCERNRIWFEDFEKKRVRAVDEYVESKDGIVCGSLEGVELIVLTPQHLEYLIKNFNTEAYKRLEKVGN